MTDTWLPLALCTVSKPSEHARGSLLALPYQSQKAPKISWALRFDGNVGKNDIPYVYLIEGSPWDRQTGTVIRCSDVGLDQLHVPGLCAPNAEIRIEIDAETWVRGREVGYYEVGPFVSVGAFGYRLCGHDAFRSERPYHWIDCSTWRSDDEAFQQAMNSSDAVSVYAKKWRVGVNLPSLKRDFSVEFRPHEVGT